MCKGHRREGGDDERVGAQAFGNVVRHANSCAWNGCRNLPVEAEYSPVLVALVQWNVVAVPDIQCGVVSLHVLVG